MGDAPGETRRLGVDIGDLRTRTATLDAPNCDGVESGTDGVQGRATSNQQEDEMSGTAGTVLRASRLRMELAG